MEACNRCFFLLYCSKHLELFLSLSLFLSLCFNIFLCFPFFSYPDSRVYLYELEYFVYPLALCLCDFYRIMWQSAVGMCLSSLFFTGILSNCVTRKYDSYRRACSTVKQMLLYELKCSLLVTIFQRSDAGILGICYPHSPLIPMYTSSIQCTLALYTLQCTLGVAKIFRFTCILFWSIPTYSKTPARSFSEE